MTTVDVLERIVAAVPDVGVGPWLAAAGVVALWLAYRAARLVARVAALGVAAVTFLAAGPAGDRLPALDRPAFQLPDLGGGTATAGVPAPGHGFVAVVTAIVDGDTLRARIVDAGGTPARPGQEVALRLLRVDAPERARDGRPADCLADEATAALAALAPVGEHVRGTYDTEPVDAYGRDLVHLWGADGRWVNGALLHAGLAQVVTFPPNTAFDDEVRAAEADARAAARGRWAPGAC